MGKVSYDYDTAAIRREAKRILSCCDKIEDGALPKVTNAQNRLEDGFAGQTADALEGSLTQMQKKLRSLNGELRNLYTALMRYADALEEADAELADMFSSR